LIWISLFPALGGHAAEDSESPVSVTELAEQLRSDDFRIQKSAFHELERLGPKAHEAVPVLIQILESDEEALGESRTYALRILGKIGPEAFPAMPTLVAMAKRNEGERYLAGAIEGIGPATVPIIIKIYDQVPRGVAMAVQRMVPEAVEHLAEAMNSDTVATRRVVAALMREARLQSDESVAIMLRGVKDPDDKVREDMLHALLRSQNGSLDVVRSVAAMFHDDAEQIRKTSRGLFITLKAKADAVPLLLELMEDEDESIRIAAQQQLGEMGAETEAALPVLLERFEADPGEAWLKGALGGIGAPAVAPLLKLAAGENRALDKAVFAVVRRMDAGAIPAIVAELKNRDPKVRAVALNMLLEFRAVDAESEPAVIALLDDPEDTVRLAAIAALTFKGRTASEEAIARLLPFLDSDDASFQLKALEGLGDLAAESAAWSVFLKTIDDDDRIAKVANQAFWRLEGARVPTLLKGLEHEDEALRLSAMYWLEIMAPVAAEAEAPLLELAANGTPKEIRMATKALAKVGVHNADGIALMITILGEGDVFPLAATTRRGHERTLQEAPDNPRTRNERKDEQPIGVKGSPRGAPFYGAASLYNAREEALPALVEGLSDANVHRARNCADLLGIIGRNAEKNNGTDGDVDGDIQGAAHPALGPLLAQLEHPDELMRGHVAWALYRMGLLHTTDEVEALLPLLQSPEAVTRAYGLEALSSIGANASAAIPAIIAAIDSEESFVGDAAVRALGRIACGYGGWSQKMVPIPQLGLHDRATLPPSVFSGPDYQQKRYLTWRVDGADVTDALPALIAALKPSDNYRRLNVVRSLGYFRQAAAPAVPALMALYEDIDDKRQGNFWRALKKEIARTFGLIGPASADAIPILLERDGDLPARVEAIINMGSIGASRVVAYIDGGGDRDVLGPRGFEALGFSALFETPYVLSMIEAQPPTNRGGWYKALASIDAPADRVLPRLLPLLRTDGSSGARNTLLPLFFKLDLSLADYNAMLGAEGELGSFLSQCLTPRKILPPDDYRAIMNWLASKEAGRGGPDLGRLRSAQQPIDEDKALDYLSERWLGTEALLSALVDTLNLGPEDVEVWAADSIGQFGMDGGMAVPALIEKVMAGVEKPAEAAINALMALGPVASAAVPVLEEIGKRPDAPLRARAERAARVIQSSSPRPPQAVEAALDYPKILAERPPVFGATHPARRYLNNVVHTLRVPDLGIRRGVAPLLVFYGDEARVAIPELRLMLEDGDLDGQIVAAEILGWLGWEARHAVPRLRELQEKSLDPKVREAASTAIRRLAARAMLREDKV